MSGSEPAKTEARRILGKVLIFSTIVSFLFVGLIINALQLVLVASSRLSRSWRWRATHTKLNGYLLQLQFAPPLFLLYYWSRIKLNIYLDDVRLIEDAKRRILAVLIPNHSYEVDYMLCFVMADQLGKMGNYKSFSKAELKYLPVVGWSLWMSDIIFVKRDWTQDSRDLSRKLDKLFDYEQILLGLFAEGTRFTAEKHQASVRFAESRGLEPLQHHLFPRARGFNYTIRHYWRAAVVDKRIEESLFRLFNLQMLLPRKLDFGDFIAGTPMEADVYCEEVELSEELRVEVLASRDEDDCPKLTQLLRDIYRRKDELVNEYRANGNKFPRRAHGRDGFFPYERRRSSIYVWAAGMIFTYSSLVYLATCTWLAQSAGFWSLLVAFVSGCLYMFGRIERESRVESAAEVHVRGGGAEPSELLPAKASEPQQPVAGDFSAA